MVHLYKRIKIALVLISLHYLGLSHTLATELNEEQKIQIFEKIKTVLIEQKAIIWIEEENIGLMRTIISVGSPIDFTTRPMIKLRNNGGDLSQILKKLEIENLVTLDFATHLNIDDSKALTMIENVVDFIHKNIDKHPENQIFSFGDKFYNDKSLLNFLQYIR